MRDLKSNLDAALSLAPAARAATANGAAVDLQGFGAAVALVQFGAWTDGTHTPELQESDDGASFAAVAAADLIGAFSAVASAAGQNSVQRVGYRGGKRYLRGVIAVSGATTGALASFAVLRGLGGQQPV
jgi:hypothetical protein